MESEPLFAELLQLVAEHAPLSSLARPVQILAQKYSFYEVETTLRKVVPPVRLFLFAEEANKSQYNLPNTRSVDFNRKPCTYVLSMSTKPREKALLDMEEGCHDVSNNLERLKNCGIWVFEGEKMFEEMLKSHKNGILGNSFWFTDPEVFTQFHEAIQVEPLKSLFEESNLYYACTGPETRYLVPNKVRTFLKNKSK